MTIPEITISVKIKRPESESLHTVCSSRQSAELFRTIFDADQIQWREEVVLICLNKANEVMGYFKVGQGGTDYCLIDSRVIYTIALNCLASCIILAHNHPTGRTVPSKADLAMTAKIKAVGDLLGITLLDHIIITTNSHYSFADNGQI